MNMLQFAAVNRHLVSFGAMTAFSSSFGQTFFISLFLPYLMTEFALSAGDFGTLYSASTLLGAVLLPYFGGLIDRTDLGRYTAVTVVSLAASAFLVGASHHVAVLGLGFVGLRLTGAGLMSHISHTVMARDAVQGRGKALGIAGAGYPLGEAVLPAAFVLVVGFTHWRTAWHIVAVVALGILLPLTHRLTRRLAPQGERLGDDRNGDSSRPQRAFLKDARFYVMLPAVLVPAFLLTAFFLYQSTLVESRGWSATSLAAAFTGYALARLLASVAIGPAIDRYTALRLMPAYLLPLAAALALAVTVAAPWVIFAYLFLAGVTIGSSGSIASAAWAEVYGPENVGAVRSVVGACSVFATATSPILFGRLIDGGLDFTSLLMASLVLILGTSILTALCIPRVLAPESSPA